MSITPQKLLDQGRYWQFGWQLVEGCTKCSPGCKNCWSLAKEARFREETGIVFHSERLKRPPKRKKPTSYSIWNDLFHPDISFDQVDEAIKIIFACSQHIFFCLTKRPEIMAKYIDDTFVTGKRIPHGLYCDRLSIPDYLKIHPGGHPPYRIPPNLWLGVTAENQKMWDIRTKILKQIPAAVRFVSIEPMLGPIDPYFGDNMEEDEDSGVGCVPCDNGGQRHQHYIGESCGRGIDWVIIGAESGPKRRVCENGWVGDLAVQCKNAGVSCFVKQIQCQITGKLIKAPAGWPREMPKGVAK